MAPVREGGFKELRRLFQTEAREVLSKAVSHYQSAANLTSALWNCLTHHIHLDAWSLNSMGPKPSLRGFQIRAYLSSDTFYDFSLLAYQRRSYHGQQNLHSSRRIVLIINSLITFMALLAFCSPTSLRV
jgi:hypothetical protein